MDVLKNKMFTMPLVFAYLKKEFHVHVEVSFVALIVVLAQLGEDSIDHPISFVSRKLAIAERNYTTTKIEGLSMSMRFKIIDTICLVEISKCTQIIMC